MTVSGLNCPPAPGPYTANSVLTKTCTREYPVTNYVDYEEPVTSYVNKDFEVKTVQTKQVPMTRNVKKQKAVTTVTRKEVPVEVPVCTTTTYGAPEVVGPARPCAVNPSSSGGAAYSGGAGGGALGALGGGGGAPVPAAGGCPPCGGVAATLGAAAGPTTTIAASGATGTFGGFNCPELGNNAPYVQNSVVTKMCTKDVTGTTVVDYEEPETYYVP